MALASAKDGAPGEDGMLPTTPAHFSDPPTSSSCALLLAWHPLDTFFVICAEG